MPRERSKGFKQKREPWLSFTQSNGRAIVASVWAVLRSDDVQFETEPLAESVFFDC